MVKIGLEVHVAISNVKTKMFCGCVNNVVAEPNTNVCPTCMGMPGSKPRINKAVIDSAIKISIALNCKVRNKMFFSRKSYFYNDMAKNFQISQYEVPLAENGIVEIDSKKIRIRRVHMEEDPGKIIHIGGGIINADYTLIDYNRSGVPLCEIVTQPDFEAPKQAREFLDKISSVLEYLEVYNALREGALRVDANISTSGERVEIKNISGFRDVEKALQYEITRQENMTRRGQQIIQETRTWDSGSNTTKLLRKKEHEEDYGYITENDLPMITIKQSRLDEIKKQIPEMAPEKVKRYQKQYRISKETAISIAHDPFLAEMFEQVVKKTDPEITGKIFAGVLLKTLNYNNIRIQQTNIRAEDILDILEKLEKKQITERVAELALRKIAEGKNTEKFLRDMDTISDKKQLKDIIKIVLKKNIKAVNDVKSGKPEAMNFLLGQVMKETKNRADQKTVREIIEKYIEK